MTIVQLSLSNRFSVIFIPHLCACTFLSPGVAVAGEATSTSSAGDMARALDAVMNPQPQEEGDAERRAPGQSIHAITLIHNEMNPPYSCFNS